MPTTWVFAESAEGKPLSITLELLTKELAREGKDERDSEHGHTLGRYIRSDIQC